MVSLAPIRYARVLKREHGPVERIEYGPVDVAGRRLQQANAYLSPHLNLPRERLQVYAPVDGTGTHASAMVARHMAISEALERWAYQFVHRAGQQVNYGFAVDGTTCGMAAYPGLFTWQARRLARREAAERHCLVHWWNRALPGRRITVPLPGVEAVEIANPLTRDRVVVLWMRSDGAIWSYGFGAGRDIWAACWRATIELERSRRVLARFHADNPGFEADDLEALDNPHERRVVHYSLPGGHAEFQRRLAGPEPAVPRGRPEPVVDMEIKGPWTRYATVWRVLYPTRFMDHLVEDLLTFYW